MHAEERHDAILRELKAEGSIRVSELADRLGVSAITIRRDVEALAERGKLVRTHGGARLPAAGAPAPQVQAGRYTFGMIVPSAGYYYPEVIRGAREAAARHGVRLILGITRYDPDEDARQVRQLLDADVDGLLVTPSAPADDLEDLPVPVVLVERRATGRLEHVISDHTQGAQLAVRHLADLGYRDIGLVGRGDSPTTPWILEGFDRAARDAGLKPGPFFPTPVPDVTHVDYDRYIEKFLLAVETGEIKAALVHNDHDAIVLIQRLRTRGLTVPDSVAIVAYDDEVAALADTPLTAIAPPKAAVGAAAVELLLNRLTDPSRPPHRLALLPELRVRSSCGAR